MKLTNIKIKNFKCFKNEVEFELNRLTLLTGANSSGKSSIIYSVLGALQSENFPFQYSPNGHYVNMGDFNEIIYNHQSKSEFSIDLCIKNNKKFHICTLWTINNENNLPLIKEIKFYNNLIDITITNNENFVLSYKYNDVNDIKVNNEIFKSDGFIDLINTLSNLSENITKSKKISNTVSDMFDEKKIKLSINDYIVKDIKHIKEELISIGGFYLQFEYDQFLKCIGSLSKKINYISSFRSFPERTYLEKTKSNFKIEKFGDGYLDQIISWQNEKSPKFKELIKIMKKLTLIDNISTKRLTGGRYELKVKNNRNLVFASLSDVGFGISQFLPIIVADLQLPDDSTLFISQPEIHLHPSVQSLFGDYIISQMKNTKKSYIIETHSEYLLNRIRLGVVKDEIKKDDLSVYFLENKKGESQTYKIEFNKSGQILNAPVDFFKTYMIDVMEIALNAE